MPPAAHTAGPQRRPLRRCPAPARFRRFAALPGGSVGSRWARRRPDDSPRRRPPDTTDAVAPGVGDPAPVITAVPVTEDLPAAAAAVVPWIARVAARPPPVPVMTAAGAGGAVAATPLTGLLDWLGGPGPCRSSRRRAAGAWRRRGASRRELSARPRRWLLLPRRPPAVLATLSTGVALFGIRPVLPESERTEIGLAAARWIESTFGCRHAVTQISTGFRVGSTPASSEVVAVSVTRYLTGNLLRLDTQVSALVDSLASGAFAHPEALVALADTALKIANAADPGAELRDALGSLLDAPIIRGAIDEAGLRRPGSPVPPSPGPAVWGRGSAGRSGLGRGGQFSRKGSSASPVWRRRLAVPPGQFATAWSRPGGDNRRRPDRRVWARCRPTRPFRPWWTAGHRSGR